MTSAEWRRCFGSYDAIGSDVAVSWHCGCDGQRTICVTIGGEVVPAGLLLASAAAP